MSLIYALMGIGGLGDWGLGDWAQSQDANPQI